MNKTKPISKNRHLITGRRFEDILEACQPKSTGRKHKNIPGALLSQLKQQGQIKRSDDEEHEVLQNEKLGFKDLGKHLLQSNVLEAPRKSLHISLIKENDGSGSERSSSRSMTPVSSYTNLYSLSSRSPTYNVYGTSPPNKVDHILQQHVQLVTSKKDRCGSYDSFSSIGTHENPNVKNKSVFEDLLDKMSVYDDNLKFEDERKQNTSRKPESFDYVARHHRAHDDDLHSNSPPPHDERKGLLGPLLLRSGIGRTKDGHPKSRNDSTPVKHIEMQEQGRSPTSHHGPVKVRKGQYGRSKKGKVKGKVRQPRKCRRHMKLNPFSQVSSKFQCISLFLMDHTHIVK